MKNSLAGRPVAAITALLLVAAASMVHAETYYLAPDGRDAGDGLSRGTAWATLNHAGTALRAGDTLILLPGEYVQTARLTGLRGSREQPIRIEAAVRGMTVLRGSLPLGPRIADRDDPRLQRSAVGQKFLALLHAPDGVPWQEAASRQDLAARAQTWWQDPTGMDVLIHPPDPAPDRTPPLEAVVLPGSGLVLEDCRHVILSDLVVRGYAASDTPPTFGLEVQRSSHIAVLDCFFANNAGGVRWRDVTEGVMSYSAVQHGGPVQLLVDGDAGRLAVRRCTFLAGRGDAVRLDAAGGGLALSQCIVRGGRRGIVQGGDDNLLRVQDCVLMDCEQTPLALAPAADRWTIAASTLATGPQLDERLAATLGNTNVLLRPGDPDPQFCDPGGLDYRWQSTSPLRGVEDRGGAGYRGDVLFVRPGGNDEHDGLSEQTALATLAKACELARDGVTVYLDPGEYRGPLRPARDGAITFRGRGEGVRIVVTGEEPAADLSNRRGITLDRLTLQAPQVGVLVRNARDIVLRDLTVADCQWAGVVMLDTQRAALVGSRVTGSRGPALVIQGRCQAIRLRGNVLGSSASAALGMEADGATAVLAQFNAYLPGAGAPLALVGGRALRDLPQLRQAGFGNQVAYLTLESARLGGDACPGRVGPSWGDHGPSLERFASAAAQISE